MEENEKQEKISVILADDHPLIRKALKDVLENDAGEFKVVAEANDGEEITALSAKIKPDIIIMDINMPKKNGMEATREIHAKFPEIIIIVLTVYTDSEHILDILEAGASGYLTKKVFGKELINAIRTVISGESVVPLEVSKQLVKQAMAYSSKTSNSDTLTAREKEILRLAASGMSNKDIASSLNLSTLTIKNYFAQIFSKLRVNSRTEAVIYALRNRTIDFDEI